MAKKDIKKQNSSALKQQKRHRRQWITFMRMIRYGANNFTRNAWLTIAATAVMTITLLVIFISVVAQQVLQDTTSQLRETVKMSIYLKTDTNEEDADAVAADLRKLSSVLEVDIKTPQEARDEYIADHKDDLETIKEATNQFPMTLIIKVDDINDTSQLSTFVAENELYKEHGDPNRDPSFAGSRRLTIERIGNTAAFAQQVGLITSAVFVGISTLIIFNTIRMAIFNRREEIQMMKLIGAERSFIRGPFVVEAIVYGFFAALIASGIGYALLFLASPSLEEAGVSVAGTRELLMYYIGFVIMAVILAGAIIGIISSLLATRRYLKV